MISEPPKAFIGYEIDNLRREVRHKICPRCEGFARAIQEANDSAQPWRAQLCSRHIFQQIQTRQGEFYGD